MEAQALLKNISDKRFSGCVPESVSSMNADECDDRD